MIHEATYHFHVDIVLVGQITIDVFAQIFVGVDTIDLNPRPPYPHIPQIHNLHRGYREAKWHVSLR